MSDLLLSPVPEVVFRTARLEDAPAIVRHLRRVAEDSPFFRIPEEALTVEHEEVFIRQHLEHGFFYLLAWEGTEVVGTLYVSRGLRAEIRHVASVAIALSPSVRGRGVASRMLAEGIRWAKGNGIEKLILNVISENTPALRLYERFGFVEEGRRRGMFRFGDVTADEVFLALDLTEKTG